MKSGMAAIQWLRRRLPTRWVYGFLWPYYALRDLWHPPPNGPWPTPPRRLAFVYGFDPGFEQVGQTFRQYLIDLCGLQAHHAVLEIGCGVGRCALPLMETLSAAGRYDGFDIRPGAIAWCRRNLQAQRPNFRFQHADLRNPTYRRGGRDTAAGFEFPFEDRRFDVVFSKSVFTHMRSAGIGRYLEECRRVLKPGGCCLHTFFLLNDASRAGQEQPGARFHFCFAVNDGFGRSVHRREPEQAIAFDETHIRSLYAAAGLILREPVRYGAWSGRPDGFSGQDIVIAIKPPE